MKAYATVSADDRPDFHGVKVWRRLLLSIFVVAACGCATVRPTPSVSFDALTSESAPIPSVSLTVTVFNGRLLLAGASAPPGDRVVTLPESIEYPPLAGATDRGPPEVFLLEPHPAPRWQPVSAIEGPRVFHPCLALTTERIDFGVSEIARFSLPWSSISFRLCVHGSGDIDLRVDEGKVTCLTGPALLWIARREEVAGTLIIVRPSGGKRA